MPDRKYLRLRGQTWYVEVRVPPKLRPQLKRARLERSTGTRTLSEAQDLRWRIHAALMDQIADARAALTGKPRRRPTRAPMTVEDALAARAALDAAAAGASVTGASDDPHGFVLDLIRAQVEDEAEQAEQARRRALATGGDTSEAEARARGAARFFGIVAGTATPLDLHLERWLIEGGVQGPFALRTRGDHRRAVGEFRQWLEGQNMPATIEAVTRQVAGRYMSEHLLVSGRAGKTVGKAVSALSAYWTWLRRRGHASETERNVWAEQAPAKQKAAEGEGGAERPFSDAEVSLLLGSPLDSLMDDFLRVALLSGLRRAEIGNLTVGDVQGGVFVVQRGKTAAARRRVPVHPDLAGIIAERCAGKAATDHLFADLPGRSGTKLGERTDAIGKRFTRWRRTLGIQDGAGRRSVVNMHSCRRWFVSKAVNAGQPPHMVSLVAGHTEGRKGMTLGRYWGGADDGALRDVVEAVRLP